MGGGGGGGGYSGILIHYLALVLIQIVSNLLRGLSPWFLVCVLSVMRFQSHSSYVFHQGIQSHIKLCVPSGHTIS